MNLKEFISETVEAIVDATTELQAKYAPDDVVINPPSAQSGADVYQAGSENYTMRRVQNVAFDVAVTAATETAGSGGAGIKVLALDVGGKGSKSVTAQNVSRVSFNIPLTFKPSLHEQENTLERDRIKREQDEQIRRASQNFESRGNFY